MLEKLFSFGGHFEFRGQLVWGLEPAIGDGCSEDPIASRVDISGLEDSWLHTSHQLTDEFILYLNLMWEPSRD